MVNRDEGLYLFEERQERTAGSGKIEAAAEMQSDVPPDALAALCAHRRRSSHGRQSEADDAASTQEDQAREAEMDEVHREASKASLLERTFTAIKARAARAVANARDARHRRGR